jgi:hypothetical protein
MNSISRRVASTACALTLLGFAAPSAAAGTTVASTTVAGGGVVHIVHGAGGTINTNQSSNWSGYNIGADYPQVPAGTTFTAISGEWKVPTATQHTSGQAEDSATWVGIGGGCVDDSCTVTDSTLIQAGTEQDVSATGAASYDAWWEIIPETQTTTSLAVKPGNTIKVTIGLTSTPGDWSIQIQNLSTHKSFSTTTEYTSTEDTVEWIEETPLELGGTGTGLATMPNLTRVHIYDATYNTDNPKFQAIDQMQLDNNGMIEATPSAPNKQLNSFNDCTWATTCPAP